MTDPVVAYPYGVGMYRERPSRMLGAVVWSRRAESRQRHYRIVPDGCLDLIWSDGTLLVAGPDTGPHLGSSSADASYTGLRFAPGTGPTVLGLPADELTDRRVPLDSIWPHRGVQELTERLASARDPGRLLESVAIEHVERSEPPDPATLAIAGELRAGRTVAETARRVGFSERQLHRRCLPAFGYGPKTLARVLRMDRALALARAGLPLADVGARAGYADQAHLSREVKALTGVTLLTLVGYDSAAGSAANRSTPLPSGSRTIA
jgi:AraC-like DNA-binding protein